MQTKNRPEACFFVCPHNALTALLVVLSTAVSLTTAFSRYIAQVLTSYLTTTQAESEAKSQREAEDQSSKEHLHKLWSNRQLVKGSNKGEDNNCVVAKRTQHLRRAEARRAYTRDHQIANKIRDDETTKENQNRNDYLWQIAQYDIAQEGRSLLQVKNIERCHKENDNNEPLHQCANEGA
jgi:hypothetical protein